MEMLEGYRAAARKTIDIVRRYAKTDRLGRDQLEATLEDNYPFWVSNGIARKVWRKETRRFLIEMGYRPRPRYGAVRINGETRRERAVRLQAARRARRMMQ